MSFASASPFSSLAVPALIPTSSAPSSFSFLLNFSRAGISFTQAEQPLNQKLTRVASFLLNKLSSTSFPSKSLPLKAGNFCAVTLLPASTLLTDSVLLPDDAFLFPQAVTDDASIAATKNTGIIFLIVFFVFIFLLLSSHFLLFYSY